MDSKKSFFETLPGILTAIGGTIAGVAALLTALYSAGIIGPKAAPTPSAVVTAASPSPVPSATKIDDSSPKPIENTPSPIERPSPSVPGTQTATHCAKPTAPVLVDPGNNAVLPNHYYGQGQPWRLKWLDSSCEGGAIQGYRIVVLAAGAVVPAIDKFVKSSEYTGDVTGTISAQNWSWKVRAVDDRNQLSDWS